MKYMDMPALELGKRIKDREISVSEVLEEALLRIKEQEDRLNCFITLDEAGARIQAEQVQKEVDEGRTKSPLAGVPIGVKDNICTKGIRTTCGSKMLSDFIPPYDACVVEHLKQAGVILLGKTNMDEFAMGSTTETSAYGAVKNPWNIEHVPGGSSGGSCGAVAAGECSISLGSDTGGSIRQPSAHCGVVGIKPTYGTVSRYGLIAYGSSLEQIGSIGKNVSDATALLKIITSYDKRDAVSVPRSDTDFLSQLGAGVKGFKVGIPMEYLKGLSIEIREAVMAAAKVLRENGADVEEFDLKLVDYAVPAYYIIASAEASSNLSRYDGVKYGYRSREYNGVLEMSKKSRTEGFGSEVKRRIMLGTFALSAGYYEAYYKRALQVRDALKAAFAESLLKYDVILGPVTSDTAPKIGESYKDPIQMYQGDIYTVAANLAGIPAISLPFGRGKNCLPIGVQLMGDHFQEKKILQAAYCLEQGRGQNGET